MKRLFFNSCIPLFFAFSVFIVLTQSLVCLGAEAARGEPDEAIYNEEIRLSGFKEHRQDEKIFDQERERGRVAYDELLEQQAIQYKQDLEEYRKTKKKEPVPEQTPDYQQYLAEKKRVFLEKEEIEESYARKTKKIRKHLASRTVSEEEELGLNEKVERVDYKKRVLYGAKPQFKAVSKSSSSGSGTTTGFGGGSTRPSSGFSQPEDFSDTGFIPPPPMPEPFDSNMEFPPPPPPASDFNDSEFPPPPPPPPDFGDF